MLSHVGAQKVASPALAVPSESIRRNERPGSDQKALRECLETSFPGILAIRRAELQTATSYRCAVFTVELAGGEERKVFLKDFGLSRLPKEDIPSRREREVGVYREILDRAELGTAQFYGAVWDEPKNRFWLFLEWVDARELRSCGFRDWVAAARWLGRMQGYFDRRSALLKTCDFLVRHDAPFFWSKAQRALESACQISATLSHRLAILLEGYDRLVEVMSCQPQTLVHGSYRPQNILVSGASERIVAIDWELAAIGSPLYDLAFLCDGFQAPRLDVLWNAYGEGAWERGMSVGAREEMSQALDCFRLHKVMKSLGDSVSLRFPESTIWKLVEMAEEIRRSLDF